MLANCPGTFPTETQAAYTVFSKAIIKRTSFSSVFRLRQKTRTGMRFLKRCGLNCLHSVYCAGISAGRNPKRWFCQTNHCKLVNSNGLSETRHPGFVNRCHIAMEAIRTYIFVKRVLVSAFIVVHRRRKMTEIRYDAFCLTARCLSQVILLASSKFSYICDSCFTFLVHTVSNFL